MDVGAAVALDTYDCATFEMVAAVGNDCVGCCGNSASTLARVGAFGLVADAG